MSGKIKSKLPDQSKIHETEQDRINQKEVLNLFCQKMGLSWKPTKPLSRTDATLYKEDSVVGRAEIKCRSCSVGAYPTYTVDARKVTKLYYESTDSGTDGYLVVNWCGDIRYLKVTTNEYPVTFQKRKDRAEKADRMYNIPIEDFTRI